MITIDEENVIHAQPLVIKEHFNGGVGHTCFNFMKKHGDKIAQIDAETGQRDTFRSLLQKSVRMARFLQSKGISQGDVVGIYSDMHPNAPVPVLASFFIGSFSAFLDTILPIEEVTHLLKTTAPRLILAIPEAMDKIKVAMKNSGTVAEVIAFGRGTNYDFLQPQPNEEEFSPVYVEDLSEAVAIFFSSGSTGLPKGVVINHYYLLCGFSGQDQDPDEEKDWERIEFEKSKTKDMTVILSFDSFYWGVDVTRLVISIVNGICRLISNSVEPEEIWRLIDKYKVNICYLGPFDIARMCKAGRPASVDTSSLIKINTGGSKISKKFVHTLRELLPDVDVHQSYGQTECIYTLGFRSTNKLHRAIYREDPECVGFPTLSITCKVVDTDSGRNLGPNERGEFYVKSPKVMRGYYNQDSSDVLDQNGWLKTGDIVYYDDQLKFHIVDRIKEFLIYQDWHVSPAFLEGILLTHPAVSKAVVIGKPHEENGEIPLGVVVLNKKFTHVTAEEIQKYVDERVENFNKLRGGVIFVDTIPVTVTGKVKRRELKRWILVENK